jgi:hypothetical protein
MPDGKMICSTKRIQDFLAARYGEEVRNLQPLKGGDWSSAYAFQLYCRKGSG